MTKAAPARGGPPEASRSTRRRRVVPVSVVVVAYVVAGTIWVVGSGPVADVVTKATPMARWAVELGLGMLFVVITALVLALSMRRRAERLDAADARTDAADARTQEADARTDAADARTDEADARTDAADARTHEADARTNAADARTDEADARTDEADARTDKAESRTGEADARTEGKTRELAASEDRNHLHATALSATATAVVITDRDGTIEWVNDAFETLSGYPSSKAVGATPQLVASGVHDEEFFQQMWETILAGKVWRGEVVNRRSGGELYTVSLTVTPVAVESGQVQRFVATLEDITDRLRAAGALEASRVRLQSLFDHALDAIVLADDEGSYIEVNPAFCHLTGYSGAELLGMGPADLAAPDGVPADDAAQFDEFVSAGAESGMSALRHKDGHVIETEYRAVADIQPGVHLSVLRDVTARNGMLRAFTSAEAQFRELAENAADIVAKLRVDGDGGMQVDYVNPAATTILGYPPERLYDDPDLLANLFRQGSDALGGALDLLPTPAEPNRLTTVQVQDAAGRLLWLEVHATLTDPTTAPVTIQLVARDITARSEMTQALEQALDDQVEAAEQLRALNAMKDTFLQSVSHELRTPLTSILGFSELLLADPSHGFSPSDTLGFQRRIFINAQRLHRLLNDLLDVDRFTRGEIQPNRVPTDLAALIGQMVDDVDLGDHPVDLDLEPIVMDLDEPWVERIVANLLRNIVRHTPPDTRIWVQTRATSDGVELTIDDDGPGIPEADRQRVLEVFQQGVPTASSADPGTGVGLSLVSSFAQLHGGGLVLAESPAGGTRVTVTLAHAEKANSPATGDSPGSDAATPPVVNVPDVQEPGLVDDATAEAERITNQALLELLQARSADQVRGIVLSVVHRLGGWTMPARLADSTALPVDLSFGIDDRLLPTAEPDSAARASLERHLPRLVEDARRTVENLARTEQLAHDASIDARTGLLNRRA